MDNQSVNNSPAADNLRLLNKDKNDMKRSCFKRIPKRYILAVLSFFGFFFAYVLRANLSVAIVKMSRADEQHALAGSNSTVVDKHVLKWSTSLQGYILSSFFYGYFLTQLPSGYWTNKYGGKNFFGGGIGVCAVLSLFIPLAARGGPGFVIALRILQGLAQGFIYPAMHCLWSKWCPPAERTRLATFALSGSYFGTVCAMSLGGIIGKDVNWEAIFYIFGGVSLLWTILWFAYVHESPNEHKSILSEEREYVVSSITHLASPTIPWARILKSPAVWAIISAHFAENWGFYTLLTELPTFLADTLDYKIDEAGLVSSLPYLAMAIMLYVCGFAADILIEKFKIECTTVRKGFCCIGLVVQGFFMFLITASKDRNAIIAFVTLAVGFGGSAWATFGVNQLDIGAGYANIVMSISNFFATIPGIFAPILAGHIIETKKKSDWNTVFYISATIFFVGAILYAFLGSGDLQPWAKQASNYDDISGSDNKSSKTQVTETKIDSKEEENKEEK